MSGLGEDQGLKAVLRGLLGEVQHLRVDLALAELRLSHPVTAGDLLEAKKQATQTAVKETETLLAKIEAL